MINRQQELKQLKDLANLYLNFYKERKDLQVYRDWQKNQSERNIELLKETIKKINNLQHDDKIKEYLEAVKSKTDLRPGFTEEEKNEALRVFNIIIQQGDGFSLLMEINRCSPGLSFINDFSWFRHGTIGEYTDYSMGKTDETVFEKYLPNQIDHINEAKRTFFTKDKYKDDLLVLESALALIHDDNIISANILIMTLIESLVRKFALQVYVKQNPNTSYNDTENYIYKDHSNSSLKKLINKKWTEDIPIAFATLLTDYAHVSNGTIKNFDDKFKKDKKAREKILEYTEEISNIIASHNTHIDEEHARIIIRKNANKAKEECSNLMSEVDKTVMIGLDTYLNFLVKQFTDDRNDIIHGKYSDFNKKWKALYYLTALETLINRILYYEEKVLSQ